MTGENRKTLKQSAMYVCIGALASTVDGSLYLLLTRQFGIWYLAANFISVNIGISLSFTLNSFLNFRKTHRLVRRAFSFFGVCYFGMILSMGILFAGTRLLGFSDIPVKAVAIVLAGIVQFLFNKFVTYGRI